MARIISERMTVPPDTEAVVFLIGVRINKPWKLHKWLPVFLAMPRMLRELRKQKDLGLLEARSHFGFPNIMVVQYWQSFEKLAAYARSSEAAHLPAWAAFNRRTSNNGDVGIWHETYRITPGNFECIYGNMPPYGLGKATELVPATDARLTAAQRMGTDDSDTPPIDIDGTMLQ